MLEKVIPVSWWRETKTPFVIASPDRYLLGNLESFL